MTSRRAGLTIVLIAAGCLILVGRDVTTVRGGEGRTSCRSERDGSAPCDGARAGPVSLIVAPGTDPGQPRRQPGSVTAGQVGVDGRPTSTQRAVTDGRGALREFIVQIPATSDEGERLAVTFVFHGLNGKATDASAYGIQDASGAAKEGLFVFPQGMAFQNDGVGWDDTCGGYDMVFFDHMLADVEARYRVDEAKVFVAGFSWGGDFATALACCRGDKIRGIAAAACTDEFRDPADYRTYANLACPVVSRAAIRFTHDADGDGAYPAPLFATTSKLFRSMNACPTSAAQATPGSCVSYPGCANPTVECVKPGIGHSPGPNWGAETWAFFSGLR